MCWVHSAGHLASLPLFFVDILYLVDASLDMQLIEGSCVLIESITNIGPLWNPEYYRYLVLLVFVSQLFYDVDDVGGEMI